jgi:hypothetical protein
MRVPGGSLELVLSWRLTMTVEAYLAMRKGSVLTFHWLNG